MKRKNHLFEPHLAIREFAILPGEEWMPPANGWSLLQIKNGSGYFIQAQNNVELPAGTMLVLGGGMEGRIRASQLGGMSLGTFNILPSRLTGLMTFGEHDLLKAAAARKDSALKIMPADHPLATKMGELVAISQKDGLSFRLKLLQLFVETIGNNLENPVTAVETVDAKERLRLLLQETPPDQLAEMSFRELAHCTHCTSRHLSRLFQELVGMSFRDKRMEIRMARARDLLANSQSKVVEVAFESGFKSLSLFNLIFSRRYGTSPGRWRRNHLQNGGSESNRLKLPRAAKLEIKLFQRI